MSVPAWTLKVLERLLGKELRSSTEVFQGSDAMPSTVRITVRLRADRLSWGSASGCDLIQDVGWRGKLAFMPELPHFDLRSRVLAAVDEGLSCRREAEWCGVSAPSAAYHGLRFHHVLEQSAPSVSPGAPDSTTISDMNHGNSLAPAEGSELA